MRLLCLVADAERGRSLLASWQALAPGARYQLCHDDIEALFVTAPGRRSTGCCSTRRRSSRTARPGWRAGGVWRR